MAYKTFAAGDVFTASDVNTYLMRQTVIACTSATRPSSPAEGMTIYETDTDKYLSYDGSTWKSLVPMTTWTAYTPVAGGGWVLGNATVEFAYAQVGRITFVRGFVQWGSTSTLGGSGLTFTLPVNCVASSYARFHGDASLFDSSASLTFQGIASVSSSNVIAMNAIYPAGGSSRAARTVVLNTEPFTWATSDQVDFSVVYEAAS